MEKQPIDDLFKRKLHDAEIAPGDAAWNALQNKLGNRRFVPFWMYAAIAASLIAVGAFGLWVFAVRDGTGSNSTLAKSVPPVKQLKSPVETQQLAASNIIPEVPQPITGPAKFAENEQKKFGRRKHTEGYDTEIVERDTEEKSATLRVNAVPQGFNPSKQNEKVEIAQTSTQPKSLGSTLTEPANNELSNVKTPATTERTLIISIESPVAPVPKPIQTITLAANPAPKTGLGSLFDRVKKIKDGEAFALSTTKTAKSGRRGLGKFYDDVKESIQNNAADE